MAGNGTAKLLMSLVSNMDTPSSSNTCSEIEAISGAKQVPSWITKMLLMQNKLVSSLIISIAHDLAHIRCADHLSDFLVKGKVGQL
jgi:hypothetical protein